MVLQKNLVYNFNLIGFRNSITVFFYIPLFVDEDRRRLVTGELTGRPAFMPGESRLRQYRANFTGNWDCMSRANPKYDPSWTVAVSRWFYGDSNAAYTVFTCLHYLTMSIICTYLIIYVYRRWGEKPFWHEYMLTEEWDAFIFFTILMVIVWWVFFQIGVYFLLNAAWNCVWTRAAPWFILHMLTQISWYLWTISLLRPKF